MKKLLFIALILTFSNTVFAKKTLNKYCDAKVNLAEAVWIDSHDGKPLDEMLQVLKEQREKLRVADRPVPYHVYVEWQRVVHNIVRHPNKTLNLTMADTLIECKQQGY